MSGAWLTKLQQHFIESRNCDMVVQVSVEQPTPKRVRGDDGLAAGEGTLFHRSSNGSSNALSTFPATPLFSLPAPVTSKRLSVARTWKTGKRQ